VVPYCHTIAESKTALCMPGNGEIRHRQSSDAVSASLTKRRENRRAENLRNLWPGLRQKMR